VDDGGHRWRFQSLDDHLRGVARRAGEFGATFGSSEWAYLAGLYHDVGKCHPTFQGYLRASSGYDRAAGNPNARFDHAIAGAGLAMDRFGAAGKLLGYVIAGHHAGLADWVSADSSAGSLSVRLRERAVNLTETLATRGLSADVLEAPAPSTPAPLRTDEAMHLWARMLFSCVVDADSLDAEAFAHPEREAVRAAWLGLGQLERNLRSKLVDLPSDGPLNALRNQVREQAMRHVGDAPGFFSLTVPTGGGKTLTSLAFALAHARTQGLRRVIYAIPYLSIIEQTAQVFRDAVGADVLEHHSSIDVDDTDWRSALAAENWDAPLVVTTTVQLFESLFASKRSQCRKLHNLAGSVIVLDEAQLLPTDFLEPILSALRVLVEGFEVTVVLCTATQPALGDHERPNGASFTGLSGVRELVDDPLDLARRLERVTVEWPTDPTVPTPWTEVAARLSEEPQVLCVVNTRADARTIAALVPGAQQLTALMCAEHRMVVLEDTQRRLRERETVRVISTQLVEAGVDIDFPVVWRALAGLDSVAQAAGRCNREGKVERGRVHVFVPPRRSPPGHLRHGEDATRSLLAATRGLGLLEPAGYRRYFELLYAVAGGLDRRGILPLLTRDARLVQFAFRTAAEQFQMIDDDGTTTVFVPYGNGARHIEALRRLEARGERPDRLLLRRLQRYTVCLRSRELAELDRLGGLDRITTDLTAIKPDFYDESSGVSVAGRDFSLSLSV
jgi:CRISPR-associated endonuclease/helicase Cas3